MISPSFDYELSHLPSGTRFLMGIDEVGRGPWAGPVTIGAFILDLSIFEPQIFISHKVRDSKTLTQSHRFHIIDLFNSLCFSRQTFSASSRDIDSYGINQTLEKLINSALTHFRGQFDFCLLDGKFNLSRINSPSIKTIVNADSSCFSVASASIIAKVDRDNQMDNFARLYPHYNFENNKGYGTKSHLQALETFGPCPIHRFSFKPIHSLCLNLQKAKF